MVEIIISPDGLLKCLYGSDMYDLGYKLSRLLTSTTCEAGYGIFSHCKSLSGTMFSRGDQEVRVLQDPFPVKFTTLEALNQEIERRVKAVNDAFDTKYPPNTSILKESQQGVAVTVTVDGKGIVSIGCKSTTNTSDSVTNLVQLSRKLTNTTDEADYGIFSAALQGARNFKRGHKCVSVPLAPFITDGKTPEQIHDDIANRIKLVNDAFDELDKPKVQTCTRYY